MKAIVYKPKGFIFKCSPLLAEILRLKRFRELYVRKWINKRLKDWGEKIDKEIIKEAIK